MDKYEKAAREMMAMIAHDCGANNCFENKADYKNQPKEFVDNVTDWTANFFEANPDLNPDSETLDLIATGEWQEKQSKFSMLKGFIELDNALNDYFDNI